MYLDSLSDAPSFSVSANGSLAYLSTGESGSRRGLFLVDRVGTAAPVVDTQDHYIFPRVSPDGERIAVAIGANIALSGIDPSDIWVIERQRGGRTRLTFEAHGQNRFFPVWSPDGAQLVYATGSVPDIFITPTESSESRELLLARDTFLFPYSWSPDGETLAFYELTPEKPGSFRDIWMMPMTGTGEPRPFLATPFNERSPTFSPDGRWMAYLSNKNGPTDVYVTPYPEAEREVAISTQGGTEVVWSRDGRELFYRTLDSLMAVPFDTETGRAGTPTRLFEDRFDRDDRVIVASANYDATPDGRFVMVGSQDD